MKPLVSILKAKPGRVSTGRRRRESEKGEVDVVVEESKVGTERRVSSAAQRALDEEDAEIRALEKKLGVRGKKKKADGLLDDVDWLADSEEDEAARNDEAVEDGETRRGGRVSEADLEWLESKRRKTAAQGGRGVLRKSSVDVNMEDEDEASSMSSDMEGGDDSAVSNFPDRTSLRENPYTAPLSDHDRARADAQVMKDGETTRRGRTSEADLEWLENKRRHNAVGQSGRTSERNPTTDVATHDDDASATRPLQGLLNRLSTANVASVLASLQRTTEQHGASTVTATLTHLLVDRMADPSPLHDAHVLLHAGFAAAVQRVGATLTPDFGATLLAETTARFRRHDDDSGDVSEGPGKQCVNLTAFLAALYTLGLAERAVIFDHVRGLLRDFSERHTELLVRMMRVAGPQLRADDPRALKDIVQQLQRSVAAPAASDSAVSSRTHFLLETARRLQHNRAQPDPALAAHTTQWKARLTTLAPAPAPAPQTQPQAPPGPGGHLNTPLRRTLHALLRTSATPAHALARLHALRLRAPQRPELAHVLLRAAAAESLPNPYYVRVARRACAARLCAPRDVRAAVDAWRRGDGGAVLRETLNVAAFVGEALVLGVLRAGDMAAGEEGEGEGDALFREATARAVWRFAAKRFRGDEERREEWRRVARGLVGEV